MTLFLVDKVFYENYIYNQKVALIVREIAWNDNLVIIEECKDDT